MTDQPTVPCRNLPAHPCALAHTEAEALATFRRALRLVPVLKKRHLSLERQYQKAGDEVRQAEEAVRDARYTYERAAEAHMEAEAEEMGG